MKKIIGIIIALIIVVISVIVLKNSNSITTTPIDTTNSSVVDTPSTTPVVTTPTTTTKPVTPTTPKIAEYTMSDVAMHATVSSCWTAVNDSVYDVTSWVNKHPGGSTAILGLCGKDGSDRFNGKHGGQSRPESELANFKIGILN